MPTNAVSHLIQLAKDLPTGLTFTNRLGSAYASDPENNNEPITIRIIDMPSDSQLHHDQQIAQEDAKNKEINNLANNINADPNNITIRITGVTGTFQIDNLP